MNDIRRTLNHFYVITGYLYNKDRFNEYKAACEQEFRKAVYNDDRIRESFVSFFQFGMICHSEGPLILKNKDINEITIAEVISLLQSGKIEISSYGRSNLDINNRDHTSKKLYDEVVSITDKVNAQTLTLMGIILAVIAFISVGLELFKNPDYFKLSFFEQFKSSTALFLPLGLIIVLLLIGLFVTMKIVNIISRKK